MYYVLALIFNVVLHILPLFPLTATHQIILGAWNKKHERLMTRPFTLLRVAMVFVRHFLSVVSATYLFFLAVASCSSPRVVRLTVFRPTTSTTLWTSSSPRCVRSTNSERATAAVSLPHVVREPAHGTGLWFVPYVFLGTLFLCVSGPGVLRETPFLLRSTLFFARERFGILRDNAVFIFIFDNRTGKESFLSSMT